MASSSLSAAEIDTTSQPFAGKAGSLSKGRRVEVVTTVSGMAVAAAPLRDRRTRPRGLSQLSVTSAAPFAPVYVAVERPPTMPHDQLPAVCGASRQSAGGWGSGVGAMGRGWVAVGWGAGAGRGVAQAARASDSTTRGAIAVTPLLWKEPRG